MGRSIQLVFAGIKQAIRRKTAQDTAFAVGTEGEHPSSDGDAADE
jgi:hypothetical protein